MFIYSFNLVQLHVIIKPPLYPSLRLFRESSMELSQHGFLEELLAPRRDSWTTFTTGVTEFLPNGRNFDSFDDNPTLATLDPSFLGFSMPAEPGLEFPFTDQPYALIDGFTVQELDSLYTKNNSPFQPQEDYPSMVDNEELGFLSSDHHHSLEERSGNCNVQVEQINKFQVFNMGMCGGRKTKTKRLEGQPSKNLMAERRRRKRLNDRLSMLRSIVPKITKMDRTSTLRATIDYMKELLERINKQQQEETELGSDQMNLVGMLREKELKPDEVVLRNAPKFDVERREKDTAVDIRCAAKPGLLLSTVRTLEALGLKIQQCAISCFNDFSMQASCSERKLISSEDIKQALFSNAGDAGGCL